jgi:hypothetical protein
MNTQENNQLIAEFMGYEIIYRPYSNGFIEISDTELCDVDDLEYHKSWDWLMGNHKLNLPSVVDKCYQEHMSKNIAEAVLSFDRDNTYRAIVEFIKEYNNQ